jgi:hypothetical protein
MNDLTHIPLEQVLYKKKNLTVKVELIGNYKL